MNELLAVEAAVSSPYGVSLTLVVVVGFIGVTP